MEILRTMFINTKGNNKTLKELCRFNYNHGISFYTFRINNDYGQICTKTYIFHVIGRRRNMKLLARNFGLYCNPISGSYVDIPTQFKYISEFEDDPYYWRNMFL